MSDPAQPVTVPAIVSVDRATGEGARGVVEALTALLADAGRVSDADAFVEAVLAREELESTVLPGGLALPHARSGAVEQLSVAVARLPEPVTFHEGKPPVAVALLIAAPDQDASGYLQVLSKLAGACVKSSFRASLKSAETADEVAMLITAAVGRL